MPWWGWLILTWVIWDIIRVPMILARISKQLADIDSLLRQFGPPPPRPLDIDDDATP